MFYLFRIDKKYSLSLIFLYSSIFCFSYFEKINIQEESLGVISLIPKEQTNYLQSKNSFLHIDVKNKKTTTSKYINGLSEKKLNKTYSINDNISLKINNYFKNSKIYLQEDNDTNLKYISLEIAKDDNSWNMFLEKGEIRKISNTYFSFDENFKADINFIVKNNQLYIKSKKELLSIKDSKIKKLDKDNFHIFQKKQIYKSGNLIILLKDFKEHSRLIVQKNDLSKDDILDIDISINGKKFQKYINMKQHYFSQMQWIVFYKNNILYMNYSTKKTNLPFFVKLRKIKFDYINDVSHIKSYKTKFVIEKKKIDLYNGQSVIYKDYIFTQLPQTRENMAKYLIEKKKKQDFRFVYFGYLFLFLCIASVFVYIKKYTFTLNKFFIMLLALLIFSSTNLKANDDISNINSMDIKLANKFSNLYVQKENGNITTISSLSRDIIKHISNKYEISKIYTSLNLTSTQVLLGMIVFPEVWQKLKIIKINNLSIKRILHIEKSSQYASYNDFFDFRLIEPYRLSDKLKFNKTKLNNYEKELLELNKIIFKLQHIYDGHILRIFPYPNNKDKRWYSIAEAINMFPANDFLYIKNAMIHFFSDILSATSSKNWDNAMSSLDTIKQYQQKTNQIKFNSLKLQVELLLKNINIVNFAKYYYLITFLIFLKLMVMQEVREYKQEIKISYLKFLYISLFMQSIFIAIYIYANTYTNLTVFTMSFIFIIMALRFAKDKFLFLFLMFLSCLVLFFTNLDTMENFRSIWEFILYVFDISFLILSMSFIFLSIFKTTKQIEYLANVFLFLYLIFFILYEFIKKIDTNENISIFEISVLSILFIYFYLFLQHISTVKKIQKTALTISLITTYMLL